MMKLRSFFLKKDPAAEHSALEPLIKIANAYDANQLSGMAQRVGCCGPNSLDPENMILVWDRQGRVLLTVADCLKARHAIGGTLSFKDVPIEPSQNGWMP